MALPFGLSSLQMDRLFRCLLPGFRGRDHAGEGQRQPAVLPGESESTIHTVQQEVRQGCTECGACVKACAFLRQYGTPGSIAMGRDFSDPDQRRLAYECSLCGLCTAICPEKIDPCRLFLAIRRGHVAAGCSDERPYRVLTGYEQRGSSALFSWYGLPHGCDTVFFPGCALPGARPAVTMQIFQELRRRIPTLGIVLDCCIKPSQDLGRAAHFQAAFSKVTDCLVRHGVRTVLTACPNCTKIFRQYGNGLAVQTVYELLEARTREGKDVGAAGALEVSIHDPCPLRDDQQAQAAVRGLLADLGHRVVEMRHHGKKAICCGEGGAVPLVNPRLSTSWAMLRTHEAEQRLIVAYCSGCTAYLNRVTPTVHIVDLLYRPDAVLHGKKLAARPPFTYWNRLLLKHRLQRTLRPSVSPTT